MSRKYFRVFLILVLYSIPINGSVLVTSAESEPRADLAIYQSFSQWAEPGDAVHFRIDIKNYGDEWVVNPGSFNDLIPEGFLYQNHIASEGTYDPATDVWQIPLTYYIPNQYSRIDIDTIAENQGWAPRNRYYIDSETQDGDPAVLTIRRYIPSVISKTNEEVTFFIELKNYGPNWAYAPIQIYDLLPEGLTYLSQNLGWGTYDPSSGIWALPGNFVPGQELTGMITAAIESETIGPWIMNTVTVSSPTNDPYLENNEAVCSVRLLQPKIVTDPGILYFGEVVLWTQSTLTLMVSNIGNDVLEISDLIIDDPSFSVSNIYDDGDILNLPVQISPSAYLYIDVDFNPTSIGSYSANLELISNDPASISTIVSLEGEGVEFETPCEALDGLLDFYDSAIADGSLISYCPGNSGEDKLRKLLENAGKAIDDGKYEEACETLESALRKVDGDPRPPDWIIGDPVAKQELHDMIEYILNEVLSCT
jgi:uncharacterized repeat protein (TIGR01451 family)